MLPSAVLFPLLLSTACTPAMMARMREDFDRKFLGEAVDGYWKAARWGDAPALSAFLSRPEDQLAVARILANPILRVTDARILQVVVGPELVLRKDRKMQDMDARWREGTALVRVEAWTLATERVEAATVEQAWTLGPRGWTMNTAVSAIDADRPW